MSDAILDVFSRGFLPTSELFRNVLNASFQGSIVILVVLLARLALKKAPKKYACLLWILVGVRLLCPFTFESKLSLQPEEPIVTQQVWEDLRDFGEIFPENGPMEAPQPYIPEEDEKPLTENVPEYPEVTVTVTTEITWVMAAPYLWMAGITALAAYSLASYLLLKRRVREAVHLFDDAWECAGIDTAFILGFLHPRIYIPMGISEGNRRYILEHERRHLEHFDNWVKLIGFIALTVHWFNPLVWLAYVLLCRDVEMACDERVIRDMGLEERKRYSAALLECSSGRAHWAACPVAFGEVSVKQRILSVLHYRKPAFWVSIIAIIAIIFVAVCFLTDPAGERLIHSANDEWEQEIRGVLEEIQSRDAYAVIEQRQFEGENILNDSADVNYFRYGDDWLTISYIDDLDANGWDGYLYLDGMYYEAVSDEDVFDWQSAELTELQDPWLYTFDMDAQEANAISRKDTDEGYEIRLLVQAPWNDLGNSYYVDFGFDKEGDFCNAILYASGTEEFMRNPVDHNITIAMFTLDIPETDIQSTIEVYAGTLDPDVETIWGSDSAEDETQPDWGLSLTVTEVSPAGVVLVCQRSGGSYPGDLMTGRYWWVEKWVDGQWETVEPVQDLAWPMDAFLISTDTTARWNCSFEWAYGGLEPGSYRIGKDFSNVVKYKVGADPSFAEHIPEEITHNYYATFEITE